MKEIKLSKKERDMIIFLLEDAIHSVYEDEESVGIAKKLLEKLK
jgi:hypothetical protein